MEKLLWLDMEMTGLDVEKERIIEIAAVITNMELCELDSYQCVVKQNKELLSKMDDWNTRHHTASGLLEKIPQGISEEYAEMKLIDLVKKHFKEPAVLAGNSVGQDKKFIDKYFTDLAPLIHYRILDVSSWKIIFSEKYNKRFNKQESHRALDDIRESIDEMRFYLGFIKS